MTFVIKHLSLIFLLISLLSHAHATADSTKNLEPIPNRYLMNGVDPEYGVGFAELGLGWKPSKTRKDLGTTLELCVDAPIETKKIPLQTRYRAELRDRGDEVELIISATVINEQHSTRQERLTGQAKKWKQQGILEKHCGKNFVSSIETGGRLEKGLKFAKKDFKGAYPFPLGSTYELGNSPAAISRFHFIVNRIFSQLYQGPKNFSWASIMDSSVGSFEAGLYLLNTWPTFDNFVSYVRYFKKNLATTSDLPPQYLWIKPLPNK